MDEFQEETVVEEASVDAVQDSTDSQESPVDNGTADAPKPDANVGEAIKREVERREAQLRKQYDEKYAPYTQHSSYLEKQAKISGYGNVSDYMAALDAYEREQQIQDEAQRIGVDPETYSQYFAPVNSELQELRQKLQGFEAAQTEQQKRQREVADWTELYTAHPGLQETSQAFNEGKSPEWFSPQMQEFIGMGYKPVHAYELAHKETLFRQKEQAVLAQVTGRGEKQILSSIDRPNNVQFNPADMSFEQIQELSARARRGERITFD